MQIFPAIDLLDSKAVRLTKGALQSAKVYGDALDFAKFFQDCGASWLHVVDLNGAFEGSPKNLKTIESILKNTNLKVQVGGGIRSEETVLLYMDSGATRLVLGSIAIKNSNLAKSLAQKYPIAISIDSKDGLVASEGWVEASPVSAIEVARGFRDSGVAAIICTDIARDGLLSGINIELTRSVAKASGVFTIASGGLASLEELEALSLCGDIDAVIVGKAFYEKKLDFRGLKFTF